MIQTTRFGTLNLVLYHFATQCRKMIQKFCDLMDSKLYNITAACYARLACYEVSERFESSGNDISNSKEILGNPILTCCARFGRERVK